jgi:hypothetical protein
MSAEELQKHVAYLQGLLAPVLDSEQVEFREWQESERIWKETEAKSLSEIKADLAKVGIDDAALIESRKKIARNISPELAAENEKLSHVVHLCHRYIATGNYEEAGLVMQALDNGEILPAVKGFIEKHESDLAAARAEIEALKSKLCTIKDRVTTDEDFDADAIVEICNTAVGKFSQSQEWMVKAVLGEITDENEKLTADLAAARSEIVALRALIEEFNNFACDCHQLLIGWHADGTAWSEWDQSVLDKLVALQRKTDPLKPAHLAVLPKATVDAAREAAEPIHHVLQQDPLGCLAATLAMVLHISYEEAVEKLGGHPREGHGYYCDTWDQTLADNGWAVVRKWQVVQPGNRKRDPWPLAPWADLHECEVRTSMNHSVIMLRDGTVLDPLTKERKRLSDYTEVLSMAALYNVAAIDTSTATLRAELEKAQGERDASGRGRGEGDTGIKI